MKTNAVLASFLFGSFALAAPVDKRAMKYKTELVVETVVVYTTVYDDEPVAQATTTPAGYFYEQPQAPSSVAALSTSSKAPAFTPYVEVQKSSSIYIAPVVQTPAPAPSSSPAPVETPKPATSAAYVAPVEVVSSAAPAPAPVVSSVAPAPAPVVSSAAAPAPPAATSPATTGQTYTNVDMTIYDNNGGFGACGTALHDDDMIVALAQPAWGASTYDVMTGAATNPWCGQKIKIDYNGNSIVATIMDLCPGCVGSDIDLSLKAWKQLTGLDEKTRLKASWSKVS